MRYGKRGRLRYDSTSRFVSQPEKQASHLAAAGVHGMNFLLTWNCKHIANPFIADRLQSCFSSMGVHLPNICTPEQFFTDDDNDSQNQPSESN